MTRKPHAPCRGATLSLALVIAVSASAPVPGRAETLKALVERESGLWLERCTLFPAPAIEGTVHAVIPARFENAAVWTTRTLILVGVGEDMSIKGQMDLTLSKPVPPREVVGLHCDGRRFVLRLLDETFIYDWDGHSLKPAADSPP